MFKLFKIVAFVWLIQILLVQNYCNGQQTHIVLDQGALVGLKVFPDSSRTAVYAFLGLPYAQPPVGDLRFSPPRPHAGWNRTLQAITMKPVCPQLTNTIYDEVADRTPLARPIQMDENCLYLNIWVPEAGMRFGNLPVLAIITGEEMSYDWARNRATGLDFATEGVVVVSVQYRSNIFGWISLDNNELNGNYGLQDQEMALNWIQQNIQNFGGDANQVTLLGHGTSGAPCAFAHLLQSFARNTVTPNFSKLVLMSGGDIEAALNSDTSVLQASRELVRKLGCHFEERGNQVVSCLRMKSVSDLQKAFESIYDHGNGTLTLGLIGISKLSALLANKIDNRPLSLPPMMIGITSNEGAFMQDYWLELAREDYQSIRSYVNYTVLPRVLRKLTLNADGTQQITEALNWRYFSGEATVSAGYLLNAMQRLISESFYETHFYRTLELLSSTNFSDSASVYAYIFSVANSMDMRGHVNLFGGASHSSDLPLLLGPSLFQQISRRRFTAEEEKLCRKVRSSIANFIKSGNPTPDVRIYDSWLTYTKERKFIYNLGGEAIEKTNEKTSLSSFEENLSQILKNLDTEKSDIVGSRGDVALSRPNRNEYSSNQYQLSIGGQQQSSATIDGRRTKSSIAVSYKTNPQDSGYAMHLKRVYGFWRVLLPSMMNYSDGNYDGINDALSQRIRLMEASADAARYKQGFFAMLGLVSVLLAILGLCVYLLRRDPLRMPSSHASEFCL